MTGRDPLVWGISWSGRIHQFATVPVTSDSRVRSSASALCGADTYLASFVESEAERGQVWAKGRLASFRNPNTPVCKRCMKAAAKAGRA